MKPEFERIEQLLREQVGAIAAKIPEIKQLEKQCQVRTRAKYVERLWITSCSVSALGLAGWMAIHLPHFSGRTNRSQTIVVSSTVNAPAQIEAQVRKVENHSSGVFSVKSSGTGPQSEPFRVYATWRIPVLVEHNDPSGSGSAEVKVLEVRRPINPKTLDPSERRLIRHLLPDSSPLSTQL